MFTKLQNRIFRLLCMKTGKGLNQREVAKILTVSPAGIGKAIKGMGNLIKIEKSGAMNLILIHLNRDEQRVVELKRVENLKQVYESGLSDYLEEQFPGTTIILFGSYSIGEDVVESDIDVAVIGAKEKRIKLAKFETKLDRKIIVNFYKSFRNIDGELKENLINGIILHGHAEL